MELRQLKYFVKVAEMKNFSEAARLLNVTQSTLSQQIKQLEGELGVELFTRNSHHVDLTDIGKEFYPSALRTISEANTCIERIRDVQNLNVGELNIGVTYTFSLLLSEAVLQFRKLYPNIKLNIYCQSVEELMLMLDKEQIDVALSYRSSELFPNIESQTIFENNLSVVMNESHPLAKQKSISLKTLEKWNLALPTKGMQARNTFERLADVQKHNFSVMVEVNDINVLLNLIRQSLLVTLLSQATVGNQKGITSVPLDISDCTMEGCYHIRKDSYMKRSTKEFLRILCQEDSFGLAKMNLF